MANYKQGTISHSTTGVKTITCGFQPLGAEILVGSDPGSTQTGFRQSFGVTDGTNSATDSSFIDTSGHSKQDRYSDRLVSLWKWDTGTSAYVELTKATFDSFTATEFKYNVITADVNHQYRYRIWG